MKKNLPLQSVVERVMGIVMVIVVVFLFLLCSGLFVFLFEGDGVCSFLVVSSSSSAFSTTLLESSGTAEGFDSWMFFITLLADSLLDFHLQFLLISKM